MRFVPRHIKEAHEEFSGRRFEVVSFETKGNNESVIRREVVCHPGSVVILPLLDDDTVVLIRNRREAVDKVLWELPAGTADRVEERLALAGRELLEETGYRCQALVEVASFYSSPGFNTEYLTLFVARGLHLDQQQLEVDEVITVHPTPRAEIQRLITCGEIVDAKTLVGLLWWLWGGNDW